MNHWICYTYPKTGTKHLVDFDVAAVDIQTKTLCGRRTGRLIGSMVEGDETLSGMAATCGTCRQVARRTHT